MVLQTLHIPVDRSKPVPLARQIQAHLERLIQERMLVPGVKLPATREMARELGVNRATVALAYDELVAAGRARAHVGQGTFVEGPVTAAAAPPDGRGAAPGPAQVEVDWAGLLSRAAHIVAGEAARRRSPALPARPPQGLISLAGGMPDSAMFPTDAFRRVLNAVIREEGQELLQYYPAGGYPPLRRFLSTYLLRAGVEARPEEILIVNGSQQGFDLIARTLLDPGDTVAIEQPTYPRAMQVFRSFGAQLVPVPLGDDGPRADALERALERHAPKLFYCQPTAHNPTGLTMSAEGRRRLYEVCARRQLAIVEDAFDGSLHYGPRPPVPLKALDRRGQVIYIGTFSNILFPGLRLGWVVAPRMVLERLEAAKQLADIQTSALIQAAVYHFCERRLLERHLARIAEEYGRRQRRLLEALARRMPRDVAWTETRGGFSLLVTLPDGLDATALLPRAVARGVSFTPGPAFYADRGGDDTLRLSFSSVPASRIDEGVRRLAGVIREARRRPREREQSERAAVPLV
jgi:GntR family transcriptional regulator/MocR family aminotransferase